MRNTTAKQTAVLYSIVLVIMPLKCKHQEERFSEGLRKSIDISGQH